MPLISFISRPISSLLHPTCPLPSSLLLLHTLLYSYLFIYSFMGIIVPFLFSIPPFFRHACSSFSLPPPPVFPPLSSSPRFSYLLPFPLGSHHYVVLHHHLGVSHALRRRRPHVHLPLSQVSLSSNLCSNIFVWLGILFLRPYWHITEVNSMALRSISSVVIFPY